MKTERSAGWARRVARQAGISRALRRVAQRLGFQIVQNHYYSPIPDAARLPAEIWEHPRELPALRFDAAAGLDFVSRELASHIAEYEPPTAPTGNPRDFYLDNGFYERIDAETLYAMVRRYAPGRIIELGSGLSTLVIADARARNGPEKDSRHTVYDPFPSPDLADVLDSVAHLHRVSANDVPLREFDELQAGDFLFVDTSHTVKIGSEVNRIILEVLPRLAPGVLIHFHDIFLPWEYPRVFLTERNFFWSEQYLLQAFLAFNDEFEVLFANHALQRGWPHELTALVPGAGPDTSPAAFWLRRVEP